MRTCKTIATISRVREEALLSACDEGNLEAVTDILQTGANMNMICESGRTPFCSAAHSGNVGILKVMIDHAMGGSRGAEASAVDAEYSTDSDESVEEETLPGDEDSASNACTEERDGQNSENAPCHCGEMDSGDTCEHCAENASPTESPPVYEPRYYSNIIRRNQRIKLLPYEIQVILDAFATTDDRNGIEEYDLEEDLQVIEFNGYEFGLVDGYVPEGNGPEEDAPDDGPGDAHDNGPGGNDPEGNAPRGDAPDEDGSEEHAPEDNGPDEDALEENATGGSAPEGRHGHRESSDEEFSLREDSVAEAPHGRDPRDLLIPRNNTSAWRSGIFTRTDCLTHKVPNPRSLNKKDHFGCRAIHYATMGGHKEALKLLINAGCKINVGDVEQLSPIHMAAARDSPEELHLLIQAGAHINVQTTDKITPLHVAASRGLLQNVKILIEKGARVNTLDSVDRSPLFMAVSRCHKDVVSYLIEKGAKLNTEEIHGYTPLYEAVSQQNLEILRILITAGAKLTHSQNLLHHAVIYKNEDVIKELIDAGCLINAKEESGDTALIIAAKTLQPRIVKLLLEHGALVNIKNPDSGEAALVQMTKNLRGKWECFEKIFSLLLQFDLEIDGETGYKALHYAIYNAEDAVAALLIRRGAIVFKNMWDVYAQLATDLFLEALVRENRLLLKLLIYAGYNFRSIRLPDRISPSLLEWLKRRKSKPLKLGELCRIVVRSKLKNKVFERVSFLNVPSSVQSYIKLENIT